MARYDLKKGMTLYCLNGETVVVEKVTECRIWVKYKGRIADRPITVVDKTLFLKDPRVKEQPQQMENLNSECGNSTDVFEKVSKGEHSKKRALSDPPEEIKLCRNCRFQQSGECSSWDPCDDFQPIYNISQKDKEAWPKEGDATRFKRTGRKR